MVNGVHVIVVKVFETVGYIYMGEIDLALITYIIVSVVCR